MLRPKDAFRVIGVKTTKGYELINAGELQTVKLGRATLIPVESVRAFTARLTQNHLKAA
jgi:excisionase family DNA binding protein